MNAHSICILYVSHKIERLKVINFSTDRFFIQGTKVINVKNDLIIFQPCHFEFMSSVSRTMFRLCTGSTF